MNPSRRRFPDLPTQLPSNLEFVLGLSPSAMTLGLGNIRALLERLGNPQRAFRSVVVAGTNGKGSVTAMLSSILSAEGLSAGRYTSPHVYSVTERVCVDDEPVGLDEMEAAAARVAPLYGSVEFSYFEAITAIAFLVFAERGVDVAVLETGLGGRFDATNVTDPEVTVITSIALDHRRLLGDTEEEIVREKLGITRPGVPLLVGPLSDSLLAIVGEKARRDGFPVVTHGELADVDVARSRPDGTDIRLRTPRCDYGDVTIPFGGPHQVTNAMLAVGAAERLVGGLTRLREGLAGAYMPGRFERFEVGGKTYVLDVAHNEAALGASLSLVGALAPRARTALVLGLMRRKELFDVPRRALEAAARVYLTVPVDGRLNAPDANEPHELLAQYVFMHLTDSRTDVILWNRGSSHGDHWRRLVDALAQPSNPAEVILVAGSHHVVEEFAKALFAGGGE
jgi:dihydrofolate synthase/folylpolyglutamate synthase